MWARMGLMAVLCFVGIAPAFDKLSAQQINSSQPGRRASARQMSVNEIRGIGTLKSPAAFTAGFHGLKFMDGGNSCREEFARLARSRKKADCVCAGTRGALHVFSVG